MSRRLTLILMTLGFLVLADLAVAVLITLPGAGALERYFFQGLSVPGKTAVWRAEPDRPGNHLNVGWISVQADLSARKFEENLPAPGVLRGYGMSFTNRILRAADDQDRAVRIDLASAPAASPNWSYGMFLADAGARQAGDVAVLGLLSSSVPGLLTLSNRTRVFDQPSPLTQPIFRADDAGGLARVDPLIRTPEDNRTLWSDADLAQRWQDQLQAEDALYSPWAFAAPWLDVSPLARLIRRSGASADIRNRQAEISRTPALWVETLRRMCLAFAEQARAEGLLPVVVLVQTRGPTAPDLAQHLETALQDADIPYLATADLIDPAVPENFLPDGHFTPEHDDRLARALLDLIAEARR